MVIQPPELGCAVTDADFTILACNQWFQAWATAPVGENLLALFPGLGAHMVAATRKPGADKTLEFVLNPSKPGQSPQELQFLLLPFGSANDQWLVMVVPPRNQVIEPVLLSSPKFIEDPAHTQLETESILCMQPRTQLEQEIIEHQRTRQALWESKAEYRDLFENTSDLIQSVGVDGHFIYVNPAWYQALGYSPEAVGNITIYDVIHPDNLAPCIPVLQRVFAGETITNFEAIFMNHIGREVMVEGRVSCLFKEGKPISTRFVLRDVTARKLAEEALYRSEQRYALAAKGTNDGLWDWDLAQNRVYFSARWKAMLGYTGDEVGADLNEDWLNRIHPDERGQVESAIAACTKNANTHFEREYRIRHKDGSYRWMLCRGVAVSNDRGQAIRMVGSQSDITERKQVEQQLLFDAFYNALTGLPNRALFSTHLERVLSHIKHNQDYLFAVLLLDLDRFKFVNESFGHLLGDQLLVEVARLLAAAVRENDIVAHLNGDEFVILLDGLGSAGEALAIAELIRQKLTPPIQIAGQTLFTTASIGVTLGSSQYEFSGDILRDAETAMYRAKNLGRDRYEVFETSLHTDLISRVQLETELRWAIDGQKLQIEYQPIVSLATQKISGVEVLLRWPHPIHGSISPLNFIPLAEETGLIVPLSEWLMRTVCHQLKTWRQAGYQDIRAAVNISVRLLQNQRFSDMVQEVLAETGLPASILEMEITESEAMLSDELSIPMLTRLNEMGICIAIDDFGMGYSSLSRLRLLPVNIIKIDYSFVRDISSSPDAQAIIRAIIALAHSLKLSVVAEGVETREQLEFLQKLQCDFIQGYYYCPPIRAEALTQLLSIQHGKFSRV